MSTLDTFWDKSTLYRTESVHFFGLTHRPPSSSFLGLPYRVLNINHKRNYLGAYGYELSNSACHQQDVKGCHGVLETHVAELRSEIQDGDLKGDPNLENYPCIIWARGPLEDVLGLGCFFTCLRV